ncbi:MAG: hypothetical protein KGM42_10745 [Hyphomicrobiales bacterium]|nr:hypothetical protein [Hyphomicrobiales bacterium]
MNWASILSGLQSLAGVAGKVAPKASVSIAVAGRSATIDAATLGAGLKVLSGIDFAAIEKEFSVSPLVAGLMTVDDFVKIAAPFVPGLAAAETALAAAVKLGTLYPPHNSGQDGVGAAPEGNSNFTGA